MDYRKRKEKLEKAKQINEQTWHPQATDEDGFVHPGNPRQIKGTLANGEPTWKPNKHLSDETDKHFADSAKNFQKTNNFNDKGKQNFLALFNHIAKDPDRHAIGGQVGDLRLRHIHNAINGKNDYSITESKDGLIISANRHSKNPETVNNQGTWHFGKNGLKFLGSQPIRKSDNQEIGDERLLGIKDPGRKTTDSEKTLEKSRGCEGNAGQSGAGPTAAGMVQQSKGRGLQPTGLAASHNSDGLNMARRDGDDSRGRRQTEGAASDRPVHGSEHRGIRATQLCRLSKSNDLQKGLNGDWQKEGYTLKHTNRSLKKEKLGIPTDYHYHVIDAHSPQGEHIGSFEFKQHHTDPNSLVPEMAHLDDHHKRKGLASGAYKMVEGITGGKVTPIIDEQSSDAKALWANPNRKFFRSEELAKGQQGDWKNDKAYTFHHSITPQGLNIKAMHHNNVVGNYSFENDHDGSLVVSGSATHQDHQRRGLASHAYHLAETHSGKKVWPAGQLTEDSKRLWSQPSRNFGDKAVNSKFISGSMKTDSYNDAEHPELTSKVGKSQDLQKATVHKDITPQNMPQVASDFTAKMARNHVATHAIGNNYHHVFRGEDNDFHFLSPSPDHMDHGKFLSEINTVSHSPFELSAREAQHHQTWHEPASVMYAKSREIGKGHGQQLYNSVLAHHGMLMSDTVMSPGAHKQWTQNFPKVSGVNADLTESPRDRHIVSIKDQDAFHDHVGFHPDILDYSAPKKMAKSLVLYRERLAKSKHSR